MKRIISNHHKYLYRLLNADQFFLLMLWSSPENLRQHIKKKRHKKTKSINRNLILLNTRVINSSLQIYYIIMGGSGLYERNNIYEG